jgi:hypothetical protein
MDVAICDNCGLYTPLDKHEKEQICWDCQKEKAKDI